MENQARHTTCWPIKQWSVAIKAFITLTPGKPEPHHTKANPLEFCAENENNGC